jgi:O-acetylhomoserine (thiol)-lyase
MAELKFTTRSLHTRFPKADVYNALQMPIYETVAFEFGSAEDMAANFRGELPAHTYSRTSNPTVEFFETKMRMLSGAYQALAVSSGMAAISNAILSLVQSGDNIISSNHLFGQTYALFLQTLSGLGIETRFTDLMDVDSINGLIDDNTRLIFFETVTNPQLEIVDIELLSNIAKKNNLVLVCDSTLTPPSVFNARKWGVDVEVMSTTKYISGGATSVGGIILNYGTFDWQKCRPLVNYYFRFGKDAFIARLRKNIFRNTGACMTPHTAYFQLLGLDILELRLSRCYENCLSIGQYLNRNRKVAEVNYPGTKGSPGHSMAKKYFAGVPGTIMTFDIQSQDQCFAFMNKLKIIRRATNLNDNKSLIIHPYSTIYAEFSEEARLEMGIRPTMMRLSVGIEDAGDLIADIEQALG